MRTDSKVEMGSPLDWAEVTVAGFRMLSLSRHGEAADLWQRSFDVLRPAILGDPRLAASHSNIGAGYILLGQPNDAEAALVAAEKAWHETIGTLQTLDFPVVGRSSSFHFKLASRNLPAFQEIRRKRYVELCEACQAITRFNRLFADTKAPGRRTVDKAARALAALLSNAIGPLSPEVRLLTGLFEGAPNNSGGVSPYAEKASEFAVRRQSMSQLLPEACGNLEVAAALTVLIAPGPYLDDLTSAEASRFTSSQRISISNHE